MNFTKLVLMKIFANLAYKNKIVQNDYSIEIQEFYLQNFMDNTELKLKDLLASIKIAYPLQGPLIILDQHLSMFLSNNQILIPDFFYPTFGMSSIFYEKYSFRFDEFVSSEILEKTIKNVTKLGGWTDFSFFNQELESLYQFFTIIFADQEKIDKFIYTADSLSTVHVLFCYLKYTVVAEICKVYEKFGEDNEYIRSIISTLFRGFIPPLKKHRGKNNEEFKKNHEIYDEIKDFIKKKTTVLEDYVDLIFHNELILENLLSNDINFRDIMMFLVEFVGFYSQSLNLLILRFDDFFTHSPSLLENFEDIESYSLLKYLFLLFCSLEKDLTDFSKKFYKYKPLLKEIMIFEGSKSIQGILFQRFDLPFIEFLLKELDREIISMIEQDNPFWNLGTFLGRGDPALDKFLDFFEEELKETYKKPRIDCIFL